MSLTIPTDLIGMLRQKFVEMGKSKIHQEIVDPRDSVFERYQFVFSQENVEEISEEEFRGFLLFENNKHWTGLHRQGPRMCSDMGVLRNALGVLVDNDMPVENRLNHAVDAVSGMGKNVATGILTIIEPDLYGVWNNRSEAVLKRLKIWPSFERGESFGSRYCKVNSIFIQIRDALQTDLWALDTLWWFLDQKEEENPGQAITSNGNQKFGLERHLHEFMRDNWSTLELGQDWDLYSEPGSEEAGYEYPCEVGRIDLLTKHKTQNKWLVIELKRNQTSDQTVGQILRYLGWVKANLAEPGDEVHGMIICREADQSLLYALSMVPDVEIKYYEVEFHLRPPKADDL